MCLGNSRSGEWPADSGCATHEPPGAIRGWLPRFRCLLAQPKGLGDSKPLWMKHPWLVFAHFSLNCYWVGSVDFNFFLEIKGFSTKPPKSYFFAGGSTATKFSARISSHFKGVPKGDGALNYGCPPPLPAPGQCKKCPGASFAPPSMPKLQLYSGTLTRLYTLIWGPKLSTITCFCSLLQMALPLLRETAGADMRFGPSCKKTALDIAEKVLNSAPTAKAVAPEPGSGQGLRPSFLRVPFNFFCRGIPLQTYAARRVPLRVFCLI